uniref:ZBR-type domain-containing protein n=1 Tax=Eptatretus burgeri TaxID=7764 RepID=A0A8C4N2T6_EPTBU
MKWSPAIHGTTPGSPLKRLSTVQEGESHSESEEVCPPQGSLQQNIGRKCGVDPWLDLGYVEELGDEAGIDTTECTSQLSRSNVTSMGSRASLNIDAESISDWQDVQPNEIGTKLPFCPTICRTRNENSLHSMFPKLALAQEAMHSQDVVPIPVVQPAWDRACEVRRSAGVDSMVAEWRGAAASYPGLSLLRLRLKQLIGRKMGEDKLDVLRELGTRDLRHHPVEAKKISHSGQRDDERCPLYCTFFPSQNLPLTNSTELPRTTDPATEFIEVTGEHIRVCPRCRGPARFKPPSVHAVCQRSSCHFDFCIRCYCAFHSSCTCQYSSRSMSHVHRRDPSPCLSRKDGRRKSLRRL